MSGRMPSLCNERMSRTTDSRSPASACLSIRRLTVASGRVAWKADPEASVARGMRRRRCLPADGVEASSTADAGLDVGATGSDVLLA